MSASAQNDLGHEQYVDLLSAARGGSNQALGTLLESCRTYLLYIGARELRGDLRIKVAPSDLVQETFTVGQQALASFRGRTSDEFKAWLRGILLNKAANIRRQYLDTAARDLAREERPPNRSSIAGQADLLLDQETPSRELMRRERSESIQRALLRLPEHYRQVIYLRNFELLEMDEIAAIMQRSPHVLRALWLRAIQRLKKELDGHEL